MKSRSLAPRALCIIMAGLLLSACMDHAPAPRHPGPYKDPVDAFNATSAPNDPAGPRGGPRTLTDDLGHLRDARSAYRHSQQIQKARQRDEQEECRQQPNARLVRIQDGSGDPNAVYCQKGLDKADAQDQQNQHKDHD